MSALCRPSAGPTHGHGNTLDLVFHRSSDNLIYSTCTCDDFTSNHTALHCQLAVPKLTWSVKYEFICCINMINMDNFSVDIANGITPDMSLSDLSCHLTRVLDKHAPVCQWKVHQQGTTPWYSSVAHQLYELKPEHWRAEHRWHSSRLAVHKQLYDAAKQKVI